MLTYTEDDVRKLGERLYGRGREEGYGRGFVEGAACERMRIAARLGIDADPELATEDGIDAAIEDAIEMVAALVGRKPGEKFGHPLASPQPGEREPSDFLPGPQGATA